jgi:hypothetical protein
MLPADHVYEGQLQFNVCVLPAIYKFSYTLKTNICFILSLEPPPPHMITVAFFPDVLMALVSTPL